MKKLLRKKYAVSDSEILKVCEKAMIKDLIMLLPDGLDTFLSGGTLTQLSGGQKQRIAIARALIRNPQVLILDEATSALDYLSERQVQKTLDNICTESTLTVVVVAHRLSTVRNSDKIFFLNDGRIAEEGTHDELIAQKGEYYLMCSSTEGDGDDDANEDDLENNDIDEEFIKTQSQSLKKTTSSGAETSGQTGSGLVLRTATIDEDPHALKTVGKLTSQRTKSQMSRTMSRTLSRKDSSASATGDKEEDEEPEELKDITCPKTEEELEKERQQKILATYQKPILRLISLNQGWERVALCVAFLAAIVNGGASPMFGVQFAKLLENMVPDEARKYLHNYLKSSGLTLGFRNLSLEIL